jgi:hypothetical protein
VPDAVSEHQIGYLVAPTEDRRIAHLALTESIFGRGVGVVNKSAAGDGPRLVSWHLMNCSTLTRLTVASESGWSRNSCKILLSGKRELGIQEDGERKET